MTEEQTRQLTEYLEDLRRIKEDAREDIETAHIEADDLLCYVILSAAPHLETFIQEYRNMDKWYS